MMVRRINRGRLKLADHSLEAYTTGHRSGTLLFIVLITVVMLALSAYTFTALMQTEQEAAMLKTRQIQARLLNDSAVDYLRLVLSYDDASIQERGGIWDNAELFQAIPVEIDVDNALIVGRFATVSPSMDIDDGTPEGTRFGLYDEASKINLNVLPFTDVYIEGGARQLLMALPNMNEEIADAIVDFIDSDDEEREFGVESNYYSSLTPGYEAKNGPLDSLDQLLLIKDITPQMLFGMDTNRNGILDEDEMAGTTALESDMQLGWANYLTLYSKESNVKPTGFPRVNINAENLEQLYEDLRSTFDETWSQFIIMYRINGPYTPEEDEEIPSNNEFLGELDFELLGDAQFTFTNVLDLVGALTTGTNEEGDSFVLSSPVVGPLPILSMMQNITTYDGEAIPGRINIMQAPRRILEGIPGFDTEIVDELIARREFELDDPDATDLQRQFETWIWLEGIVDLETMRTLMPFICCGGDVYKAEIVGYFDDDSVTARTEVILDTTVPIPRILNQRNKSHLPAAYSIDILGRELVDETR